MISIRPMFPLILIAALAAALTGCGKSAAKNIDETISLPVRGVRAGAESRRASRASEKRAGISFPAW